MPLIRKDSTPLVGPRADGDGLSALLREGDVDERWAAARGLGGSPEDIASLASALGVEHEPRVREAIFTSLANVGTAQACRALLASLRSDDAGLRTGALDALSTMAAAGVLLPELLADPDPDVRLLSCEIARSLPAADAQRLLCALLDTEVEVNVCAAAIEVLAELGGPDAISPLTRCAERFADDPFLVFAVKVARRRLEGSGGDRNG